MYLCSRILFEKSKIKYHVILLTLFTCFLVKKENCEQQFKLQDRYIRDSEKSLKYRICEHLGYIRNKNLIQAAESHFNLPGHSQDNLKVTSLELVLKTDVLYRKEREAHLIRNFNTFYRGLNRMPYLANIALTLCVFVNKCLFAFNAWCNKGNYPIPNND